MKYEYNAINNPRFLGDRLLNKLGEDGWELVSHAYSSNTGDHFYTFKRGKIEIQEEPGWVDPMMEMLDKEEKESEWQKKNRKFKLDDSFKKTLEEAVVSDTPASSWMDEYYDDYIKLQASGMMFEFHPTWTGVWEEDKYAFCHDRKYKKK